MSRRRAASDVWQRAGPYASALAEELSKPGVEAVTIFRNVQLKVKQTIGQDPWLSFPTLPAVYLAGKQTAGAFRATSERDLARLMEKRRQDEEA